MADVTGIFGFSPGGTANFGDWTTFYFSLCLQNLAPGLEHRGLSKSVCDFASSQEGCGQCVYSPQTVLCVGLVLTTATFSLFRKLPSTPWPEVWDSHSGWHPVRSPHCHGGRPFLHFKPLYMPLFPMETYFSLSWALEVSQGLGEGTGLCSLLLSSTGLNVVGKIKLNYKHLFQELRWFVTTEQPL